MNAAGLRAVRRPSELEAALLWQLRVDQIPTPTTEHVFAAPRRWRFDLAWPDRKLAVEVEGGIHTGGRHVRGQGFENDLSKYNAAVLLGWRVLRVSGRHVETGEALDWIKEALQPAAAPITTTELRVRVSGSARNHLPKLTNPDRPYTRTWCGRLGLTQPAGPDGTTNCHKCEHAKKTAEVGE